MDKDKIIKILDEIFDNFDFEKVKAVMDKLDWKWAFLKRLDPKDDFKEKTVTAVPTLDEIKEAAAKLMWDCANDPKNAVIATGGFRVEKDFNDPDGPWMRLSFEITDWDAWADKEDETDTERWAPLASHGEDPFEGW